MGVRAVVIAAVAACGSRAALDQPVLPVVLDQAPDLGSDPLVVRVSAHRAGAQPKCRMLTGVQWQRGDVTSETDFIADAPALAGHFTYAMYISCSAM